MVEPIRTAMVLAAGFGKRMRPLTETIPKPMVPLAGRPLIDHVFERLIEAGVTRAVVNVHYKADILEEHVATWSDRLDIQISDERAQLMDTGGGVKQALRFLGDAPFFVIASDTVWLEGPRRTLSALAKAYDPDRMDMLLLLAATATSVGDALRGDFEMDTVGRLTRRVEGRTAPFAYASALVTHAGFYAHTPDAPFSNNLLFDRAIAGQRLFGQRLDGIWMHVGSPPARDRAERALAESVA